MSKIIFADSYYSLYISDLFRMPERFLPFNSLSTSAATTAAIATVHWTPWLVATPPTARYTASYATPRNTDPRATGLLLVPEVSWWLKTSRKLGTKVSAS